MTKLEKLRDELSAKNQIDKPSFCGVDMVAHKNFCSGWDARDAIAKEREAELIRALELCADWFKTGNYLSNIKIARQALADHKRMMEE